MNEFTELPLIEPLQRALRDEGYSTPTPIQAQSIPALLDGRDLLGCARTGTGKTAAFALPILQRLEARDARPPRKGAHVLVLVPTRELATQVAQSFAAYGRHLKRSIAVVFGGVGQKPQVRALERGVDVLVATPGRLLDLMGQRHARLESVETLVLDEADQMLDLGFLPDVRRILGALESRRHTVLFSATMPTPIEDLARRILKQPEVVRVAQAGSTAELVEQRLEFVQRNDKPAALERILRDPSVRRALVFTRTKRGCDRLARRLVQSGVRAEAIHGDKSQGKRERSLAQFRSGHVPVLVATDIAARGIDIDDISHVVNYEIPNVPETYVHRIGRTARAGSAGVAISLCDGEERAFVRDIERLMRRSIPVTAGRPQETRNRDSRGRDSRGSHGRDSRGQRPDRPERGPAGRPGDRGLGRPGSRRFKGHAERPPVRPEVRAEVRHVRQESEEKVETFGQGI